MEFATDVVGDDVVQRTAGEALRNTLTYAVKPGMTLCKYRIDRFALNGSPECFFLTFFSLGAVLALSGVGLLFFSVVSLGYATRSSEKEAAVFYDAVSDMLERLWGTVGLPFQVAGTALTAFFNTVLLPYHFVQRIVARIEYTGSAVNKALYIALNWTAERISSAVSVMSRYGSIVGNFIFGSVSSVKTAGTNVTTWTVGTWRALVSFFAGMGSSVGVKMERLSSWFVATTTILRRETLSRIWVVLGTISGFFIRIMG